MVKQNEAAPGRGGAIINMSSVNAIMAIPTVAGYNASKGGVANLTRCVPISPWERPRPLSSQTTSLGRQHAGTYQFERVAVSYAALMIWWTIAQHWSLQACRCMALALAPHSIRVNAVGPGSIMTDILASVATDEAARNRLLSRIPMGRIGDASEVGEVVAFLASPAASYITGIDHVYPSYSSCHFS